MENLKIQDLEAKGLTVAGLLGLLDVTSLDGEKLRTLMHLHSSDFNTSFENSGSKKIQVQSLLNNYSSEVSVKDVMTTFSSP